MHRVTIVSFDVFGTLIDIVEEKDRPEAYTALSRWFGYHGVRLEGIALQQQLQARSRQQLSGNPQPHPDVDIQLILADSVAALAPAAPLGPDLLAEACHVLRTLTTVSLAAVPGAADVLQALAPQFRLGICSNTQRAYTIGELRGFDLLNPFEHVVISSDVKACKPNPIIFKELIRQFQVPAEQIVHVGDRLLDDVAGAAALGMRTIWIQRDPDALLPAEAVQPGRVVKRLDEVPAAVRSLAAE